MHVEVTAAAPGRQPVNARQLIWNIDGEISTDSSSNRNNRINDNAEALEGLSHAFKRIAVAVSQSMSYNNADNSMIPVGQTYQQQLLAALRSLASNPAQVLQANGRLSLNAQLAIHALVDRARAAGNHGVRLEQPVNNGKHSLMLYTPNRSFRLHNDGTDESNTELNNALNDVLRYVSALKDDNADGYSSGPQVVELPTDYTSDLSSSPRSVSSSRHSRPTIELVSDSEENDDEPTMQIEDSATSAVPIENTAAASIPPAAMHYNAFNGYRDVEQDSASPNQASRARYLRQPNNDANARTTMVLNVCRPVNAIYSCIHFHVCDFVAASLCCWQNAFDYVLFILY